MSWPALPTAVSASLVDMKGRPRCPTPLLVIVVKENARRSKLIRGTRRARSTTAAANGAMDVRVTSPMCIPARPNTTAYVSPGNTTGSKENVCRSAGNVSQLGSVKVLAGRPTDSWARGKGGLPAPGSEDCGRAKIWRGKACECASSQYPARTRWQFFGVVRPPENDLRQLRRPPTRLEVIPNSTETCTTVRSLRRSVSLPETLSQYAAGAECQQQPVDPDLG